MPVQTAKPQVKQRLKVRAGVDIKTVSETLGHATVAFTLDVYCHVTEEMRNEAAAKMDALIEGHNRHK